ncbi:MAG: hypothetical protein N2D54_01975, partial [Chloroflexota bacterium]
LHPTFPFLDKNGENVLVSGEPVSTMETCGSCHDTTFIEEHSFHAQVGFDDLSAPGETSSQRAWDTSSGLYGRWNALTYRYLSPQDDDLIDLTTEEWLQTIGLRHVGGGPALDQGGEMNCFLCHFSEPNNQSRIDTLESGLFEWANTATLLGTGIVTQAGETLLWNETAFDDDGELLSDYISIQDPDINNCGQCHGLTQTDDESLAESLYDPLAWNTQTTGQIFSSQRLSDSELNLSDKEMLTRSWDIHAERLLECTDCHFSLNNPIYAEGSGADSLEHLTFDPRRLDFNEYLVQPSHQFARGESAQSLVDPASIDSMRRCESCHDVESDHEWLPYQERHIESINCESCHIPEIYAPAVQQNDWTAIQQDGSAINTYRGVEGDSQTVKDLITGYTPVLMQRENVDGSLKLTPYNLITSWFWVYGDPPRPVRLEDLQTVWLNGDNYHQEILSLFDENNNDALDKNELRIDSPAKEALIKSRLQA